MSTDADPVRQAVEAGRAAMGRGDQAEALRWLDRAKRLAPKNPVVLHVAVAALARGDPERALKMSDELVAVAPWDREARIGQVALLHRCGRHAAAAAALDALLGRFAAPRSGGFAALAGRVARQAGAAGWVGATSEGAVLCHAPAVRLWLDGAALAVGEAEVLALPARWVRARALLAGSGQGRVLGAAIDLAALRRVEGFAEWGAEGVRGWAVRPADPEAAVVIEVVAGRRVVAVVAAEDGGGAGPGGAAVHARGFSVAAAGLPAVGALQVRARHGGALAGSPVRGGGDEAWGAAVGRGGGARAGGAAAPAGPRGGRRRAVDVVILALDDAAGLRASVDSVRAGLPRGARIVVVADGSLAPGVAAWARGAARAGGLVLLRRRGGGAAAAVNAGLRHAGERDVLVLACGSVLLAGGLARLRAAAGAAGAAGTVTPMTLGGGVTSVGAAGAAALAAVDEGLRRGAAGRVAELPVCGTTCTYIKYACWREAGPLRADLFPASQDAWQDFARRAAARGWRHLAACDVAVQAGGAAPAGWPYELILERLWPGHAAGLAAFAAAGALREVWRLGAAVIWQAGRAPAAIVLVTHADGGGVERHLVDRVASIRDAGMRAVVVRPGDGFAVSDGLGESHPGLTFETVETLAAFLRADRVAAVELHHTAAHAAGIERLAGLLRVPFDIVVHDYSAVCPRVTLSVRSGRYCGEPADTRECDDCIADRGARMPFSGKVADLRTAQAAMFGVARAVIAPSQDTARRLRRYMARVDPLVRPWQDDAQWPPAVVRRGGGAVHVAVCGAISAHKGYNVLLGCARDAARRDLNVRFTVVGHTEDDARLLATGRVFVTGPYQEDEAAELLQEVAADIGFIPSVWPETWCFALSHLWQAGLHVAAFDLGAQAERIAARGGGTVLPLGMEAGRINDLLLGISGQGKVGGAVPSPPNPPSRIKNVRRLALGVLLVLGVLPSLAQAHFSIADYAPAGTVLDNTGHADASAALAGAIRAANVLTAKGEAACVYVPPGTYRIVTPPPAFARAGCIKGDGPTQSTLLIDPAFAGDLFAWSEAWWPTTPGPTVTGLKIRGSAGATRAQNAMVFYDRNDQVFIDNIEVDQLHGRALYSGVKLHTSQAYMRESHMRSLRFFMDGAPGVPVVEFSSEGQGKTDATNEIALSQVDIFGPGGPGFVIRNNGNSRVRDFVIEALRIEGWQAGTAPGDLMTIGDAQMRGNVNNIRLTDIELIDPQAGYAALRLTSAPGVLPPYQITVQGTIGGGAPRGEGLRIDAGCCSVFRFSGIHSFDTNVVIGAGVKGIVLDGAGQEPTWTYRVAPGSVLGVAVPVLAAGGWRPH